MTKNRPNRAPRAEANVERDALPDAQSQELPIRIVTHNIRYATTSPFPGEEPWDVRAPHEIAALRFHTLYNPSSFVCLQEVLSNQLSDILDGLNRVRSPASSSSPIPQASDPISRTTNASPVEDESKNGPDPEWSYIGVGRDDGRTGGEYSPIFFRPARWALHHSRTIWLSPTPSRPSKGWDAACPRILTIGLFEHRETRKRVLALNTHLDHRGEVSRAESAKMIVETIRQYLGSPEWRRDDDQGLNVFLTGDMNSEDHGAAYRVLESTASPVADVLRLVPEDQRHGHYNTGTGFGGGEDTGERIDYVFLGKQGSGWSGKAVMYGVLGNRERGIYVSDHRAVVADVVLGG